MRCYKALRGLIFSSLKINFKEVKEMKKGKTLDLVAGRDCDDTINPSYYIKTKSGETLKGPLFNYQEAEELFNKLEKLLE